MLGFRAMNEFAARTWTTLCDDQGWIALLPVGAIEAHGPHLPLGTDTWIAEAMATRGAIQLEQHGIRAVILPVHSYTAATFASGFPGTVDTDPAATESAIDAAGRATIKAGAAGFVVVNAHFDPANIGAIRRAVTRLQDSAIRAHFFDLTRRKNAQALGGEFATGACHAGRYEGSLMLAIRPDLVDEKTAAGLPPYPVSLSEAVGDGATSFEEIGGDQAYFGWPAEASRDEGEALLETIGELLAAEVTEIWTARETDAKR